MRTVYSFNQRKLFRLIEALDLLGFTPENTKFSKAIKFNQAFFQRIKAFMSSIGGEETRRAIDAFRVVAPRSFGDVPRGQSYIDLKVKKALVIFFARIFQSKDCHKAIKIAGIRFAGSNKLIAKIRKQTIRSIEKAPDKTATMSAGRPTNVRGKPDVVEIDIPLEILPGSSLRRTVRI